MQTLQNIKIEKFRGIQDLEVENLSNFNLFVGENNTGKTSILEAIKLVSNPFSSKVFYNVAKMRENSNVFPGMAFSRDESIRWLFKYDKENRNEKHKDISIEYQINQNKEKLSWTLSEEVDYVEEIEEDREEEYLSLINAFNSIEDSKVLKQKIKVEKSTLEQIIQNGTFEFTTPTLNKQIRTINGPPLFACNYISSIDHKVSALSVTLLNRLIQEEKRDPLLDTLKFFDKDIIGIEILMSKTNRSARPLPYLNHKELGIVPINMFGDGIRKALIIASKVMDTQGGVLLIDEIETGIHTSLIPEFIKWITELCNKYQVQLFATTHSLEAVDGILKARLDHLENLSFYRILKEKDNTKIKYFSGNKIKNIRYDFGQDIR